MTEYFDSLEPGKTITVTTEHRILSGNIVAKREEGGMVAVNPKTKGEKGFLLRYDAGPRNSEDEGHWGEMEYTLLFDGEKSSVRDIRWGHYSMGENPNLLRDDVPETDPAHPDFDWDEAFRQQEYYQGR